MLFFFSRATNISLPLVFILIRPPLFQTVNHSAVPFGGTSDTARTGLKTINFYGIQQCQCLRRRNILYELNSQLGRHPFGRKFLDQIMPFNRRHLLFGRVPLKRYEQASFTFLKFENYGTEQLGDIVRHGIQYGLHVMKRESREKMPSRRETVGKRIFQRFQELVQLIFEFPSLKPIIKHDSMEQVLDRRYEGLEPDSTAVIMELELTPHSKAGIRTEQDNTSAGVQWKMNY